MSNSELLNGWKECLIGEIFHLYQGLAINSKTNHLIVRESKLPLLRIKDLQENTQEIFIDDTEAPQKCIATENDLIFTRTGIVGLVFMGKKGVVHNNCFRIVPKFENTYLPFYFYYFNREAVRDYLTNIAAGSVQPDMNHTIFKTIQVPLPPLAEQKAIAEVLSSLDDKIDLLHRQNQTLEDMAQTLFREWFIEKADDEWEEVKLGDIIEPKKGKNITKKQAKGGDYPVVAGGLEPSCYHNNFNTKSPVVTISASGANAGYVRLYLSEVWSSDSSFIDSTITDYVYFFYIFLKYNQQALFDKQTGSAQPHIYPAQIMDLDILKPPINLMLKFENIVKDIFSKIGTNQKQIKALEETRDTLLPKLMSGEVRVK